MYLGLREIDDTLTFSVNTHTPSTGAAVDADSAPTYRIYEDETGAAILTGTMSLLDDANTTGFYSEQITLSAANGLEVGKSYNIRVSATVGGVAGSTVFYFGMGAAPLTTADLPTNFDDLAITATTGRVTVGTSTDKTGYSISGTLTTLDALDTAQDTQHATTQSSVRENYATLSHQLESQRGAHSFQAAQAQAFYVDPVNGDTHANGNRGGIDDPYDSIQDCHDNAVVDSRHDIIFLVAGNTSGATTTTEPLTLSKRYLQIRGPGRDFIVTRSTAGDTITVTADGIGLEGFQVNTAGSGSGVGVEATGVDFLGLRKLWFNDTRGDAVALVNCTNAVISGCNLQGSGQSGAGNGISISAGAGQNSSYCRVFDNYIDDVDGDGIRINSTGGGTIAATSINNNRIFNATGTAINIVNSGATDTVIFNNIFAGNATNYENNGTSTTYINNDALYDNGAIWVDSVNGSDGNPGTAQLPVATWAGAVAIATATGLSSLDVKGALTLGSSAEIFRTITGHRATLALGGQNIGDVEIINFKDVTGIGTTSANRPVFTDCGMGLSAAVTLPPSFLRDCEIGGGAAGIIFGSAGEWDIDYCSSGVAGTGASVINTNSTDNNTVGMTSFGRGVNFQGLSDGDVLTVNGALNTVDLDGASPTVNISGQYGTVDTSGLVSAAGVTVTNAFRTGDIASTLADTNELQTDLTNGGRLDLILDELTAQGDTNEGKLDIIDVNVDAVLVDTNELQTNQGDWVTADVSSLATSAALATAQTDLDTLTGADGATLATLQPNYAPNTTAPPTAAAIRSEIDSNSTQLAAIVAAVAALEDLSAAEVLTQINSAFTTQMADSVPADGNIATREQALYMMLQYLTEKETSGTTMTVKKVDGSTTLYTLTLDDDTTPTSITRAS
jgi:hypothetical protein